jgi:hypothetical protein
MFVIHMRFPKLRRIYIFIGFSVLVHLTVLRVLFLNPTNTLTPTATNKPFLELLEHVGPSAGERVAEIKRQKREALRRQGAKQKWRLDEALQKTLRTDISMFARPTENSFIENIESSYSTDGATDIQGLVQKNKFLPVIWRQIRGKIFYRPEHLLAQNSGHVRIVARVDKRGKLLRLIDEDADGKRELLGWVMLCVADALKDPVLTEEMDGNMTLDLNFYFTFGESPPPVSSNTTRMVFAIEGPGPRGMLADLASGNLSNLSSNLSMSRNSFARNTLARDRLMSDSLDDPDPILRLVLLKISTDEIANLFKDRTLKNHHEWDFYTREEKYKHQCEKARNPHGCFLLTGLYRSIGKNREADKYEEFAQSLDPEYDMALSLQY